MERANYIENLMLNFYFECLVCTSSNVLFTETKSYILQETRMFLIGNWWTMKRANLEYFTNTRTYLLSVGHTEEILMDLYRKHLVFDGKGGWELQQRGNQ